MSKPPPLSHNAVFAMQSVRNLSDRAIKRQAQVLRQSTESCFAVQPGFKAALTDRGRRLEQFFTVKSLPYVLKPEKGEPKMMAKPTIIATDLAALVQHIGEARGMRQPRQRVGLYGGGGFLKACLNIIEDQTIKSALAKKPAVTSGGDRLLGSGVMKLFIIGLFQGVPKNYFNMKTFLQELGLNCITFCLSLDLKLSNILAGLGPHSSTYPHTWCEAMIKNMQQKCTSS